MPIPPAAIARWNSISASVTRCSGERASNVADFTKRLRSPSGPSWARANGSTSAADLVVGDRLALARGVVGPGAQRRRREQRVREGALDGPERDAVAGEAECDGSEHRVGERE